MKKLAKPVALTDKSLGSLPSYSNVSIIEFSKLNAEGINADKSDAELMHDDEVEADLLEVDEGIINTNQRCSLI